MPNEYKGIVFTIRKKGSRYILNFFIREVPTKRNPPMRITMEPDPNHKMPHIHLSKGHCKHIVSLDLTGNFIHGETVLNRNEKKTITEWISSHRTTLQELWDSIQAGDPNYQDNLDRVNNTWEFDGCVFEGERPINQIILDNIIVWYNGILSKDERGDITHIHSSGEMCVLFSTDEEKLIRRFTFRSDINSPQIGFRTKKN